MACKAQIEVLHEEGGAQDDWGFLGPTIRVPVKWGMASAHVVWDREAIWDTIKISAGALAIVAYVLLDMLVRTGLPAE